MTRHIFSTFDTDDIINSYITGESVYSIANRKGLDRGTINRLLLKNGCSIRGLSESQLLRFKHATYEEKAKITQKANEARRASPAKESELINHALAAERGLFKVGEFEKEMFDFLKKEGFSPVLQKAWRKYNFDICVGNVAVEIHQSTCNPINKAYTRKKLIDVIDAGNNIIFVWINPRTKIFSESACQDVTSFIKRSCCDPSFIGQYRVVRGTGELYAASCLDSY